MRTELALALCLLSLVGCAREEQAVPAARELIRPVRYVRLTATHGERERTFTGTARAGVESKLSFKVPGTIRSLPVKTGDTVSAGAVVAVLDDKDYALKVQQAVASVRQAKAASRNGQASYGRVRALYENNSASRSDLDAARARAEEGSATVTLLEKQLEQARLQLAYATLRAPSNCSIASVLAEENENVAAGQAIVLVTYGASPEVQLSVPETYIALIEKGMHVRTNFDAFPGKEYAAIVTEVGIRSTTMATTYPVVVRLLNETAAIRSGMAASVTFRFDGSRQTVRFIVPSHALSEDTDGQFVYVVERISRDRGRVSRRAVRAGSLTAAGIEILDGVREGELVVTAGVSKIRHGLTVKIGSPAE